MRSHRRRVAVVLCCGVLACAGVALAGVALLGVRPHPVPLRHTASRRTPAPGRHLPPAGPELMPGVVAPLLGPSGRGATVRQLAVESIGTYEWRDWTRGGGPIVNTNGDYWSHLADLAWRRPIEIHLDDVPLDLDLDGAVDVRVTRHLSLPGGILGNPEVFGLPADPDDPPGRRGSTSVSTGFLGLRDPIDPATGEASGTVAMTCWLCHGGRNPADGKVVLGLASVTLDYGLLLATSSLFEPAHRLDLDGDGVPDRPDDIRRRTRLADDVVLDRDGDGQVTSAEYRAALGLPDAKVVQATLLLGGPGRADLTNQFGLDMTPPGLHSRRYAEAGKLRTGAEGVFNPKSIPHNIGIRSLPIINWAATYATRSQDWLDRYLELTGQDEADARAELDLGGPAPFAGDRQLVNRAMVLDLRTVGAIGLQGDAFAGLLYVRAMRAGSPASPELVRATRLGFEATAVRRLLYDIDAATIARAPTDPARVARGRALFFDAPAGELRNEQILVDVPPAYQGLGLAPPLVAPLDESLPRQARLPVRCVTCHSATTLDTVRPIPAEGLAVPRCTDCHYAHGPTGLGALYARVRGREPAPRSIFEVFGLSRTGDGGTGGRSGGGIAAVERAGSAAAERAVCRPCHREHSVLAEPVTWTSCLILPFDADEDGNAQGDEADDGAAGGIGTDALFGFEVDRRALADKSVRMQVTRVSSAHRRGQIEPATIAGPWVRTPPLVLLDASAPFLHNGSVPTLEALFEPPAHRPRTFPVGRGRGAFTFDTALPGNRNTGHLYGTTWTAEERRDLVEYLRSL